MRWYVQQHGQTSGPVDASTVAEWVRQGQLGPSTLVAPEGSSSWMQINNSPFVTRAVAPPPKTPNHVQTLLVVLLLMAAVLGTCGAWLANGHSKAREESSSNWAQPPRETVVHTVSLEVGEGDDRTGSFPFTMSDATVLQLAAGTPIERLSDAPGTPEGMGRVRVTDGSDKGKIGLLPLMYIQAAR